MTSLKLSCFSTGDPLALGELRYPCVVKASLGEDTKAVRLVKDQEALHKAIEHALSYSDHVIIERYNFLCLKTGLFVQASTVQGINC